MTTATVAEADAFMSTTANLDPGQLTKCPLWTAHALMAHLVAGAAEIARNVEAFNSGGAEAVPPTRALEEREAPFHAMAFDQLRTELSENHDRMSAAVSKSLAVDPNAVTPWVDRQMPIAAFVTHARSEYALHRWDLVGDDDVSNELLSHPDLTTHAVLALGSALTSRAQAAQHAKPGGVGASGGAPTSDSLVLTTENQPDILVTLEGVSFNQDAGEAEARSARGEILADPAARLLLLWGRMPDQPGRIKATGGPAQLEILRTLLAGY